MRRLLKWFLMLNKRLYKKVTFLVILALIPICVFSFSFIAREDSGFLHIVLAQTDGQDELSSQVVRELMSEDSIIRFSLAKSPDAAVDAVKTGQADEAWIFPENMQSAIQGFAKGETQGVVGIVAREQTVFLRLSHEKLTSALYKHCAKAYYIDYARTNVPRLDSLTDEELISYFEEASISEELFEFDNPTAAKNDGNAQQSNYLTTPIRGLLGILIVICGMAAALYYIQDEAAGTFSWIPESNKIYIAFACLMIAILNVAAVVLISLFAAGLATDFFAELVTLLLYSVCCAVFCLLLGRIFTGIKLYGATIPLFTVIMIAVCPVFFDFRSLLGVQLIFPPTYYVNAAYDGRYMFYMVVYALVGALLCFLLEKFNKIKKRVSDKRA